MAVFKFISDPSHGWMVVDLNEYPEAMNYGSGWGYIDGNTIYLEEDVEAENFIYHLMSMGEPPTFDEVHFDYWHGRDIYPKNVRGIHYPDYTEENDWSTVESELFGDC
jgi:hypothetical protein